MSSFGLARIGVNTVPQFSSSRRRNGPDRVEHYSFLPKTSLERLAAGWFDCAGSDFAMHARPSPQRAAAPRRWRIHWSTAGPTANLGLHSKFSCLTRFLERFRNSDNSVHLANTDPSANATVV